MLKQLFTSVSVIRLREIEGPKARDQIVFCAFHSFFKTKRMLAKYIRRMRNNNLEIRIAGSSCRPQLKIQQSLSLIFENYTSEISFVG